MTLNSFKKDMIAKAKKKSGIWENFGQDELYKLKIKYNYNPYANQWGDKKEYKIKIAINELDRWAMNFSYVKVE